MKSPWTERVLQDYREFVCSKTLRSECNGCTKTKDEIGVCYWDLFFEDMEGSED